MKKLISIIALLTACVSLTACSSESATGKSGSRFEGLSLVRVSSDYIRFSESFNDIENFSDFVVIGEFIGDSEVCYEDYVFDAGFQKDILMGMISSCPMKITRVLSGNANVGDIVNVLQEEGIQNDRFISFSELTPMQKGDEWIFCLSRSKSDEYDGYWCVGDSRGRYPTKKSASNEVMCFSDYPELGVYYLGDFKYEFYDQLIEKYGSDCPELGIYDPGDFKQGFYDQLIEKYGDI